MMPEDEVVSIQNKQTLSDQQFFLERNPHYEIKLMRIKIVLSIGESSWRYGRQWGRGN